MLNLGKIIWVKYLFFCFSIWRAAGKLQAQGHSAMLAEQWPHALTFQVDCHFSALNNASLWVIPEVVCHITVVGKCPSMVVRLYTTSLGLQVSLSNLLKFLFGFLKLICYCLIKYPSCFSLKNRFQITSVWSCSSSVQWDLTQLYLDQPGKMSNFCGL